MTFFYLTILESLINIISLEMLFGCSLRTNGCDIFWDAFGCSLRTNAYYDLFWDTLWLLVENQWNFVIYHWYGYCDFHWCLQLPIENCCDHDYHLMLFSFSWRFDVIILDYLFVLSSYLYRTEVILLWFFDLWFHELRVGNLYVVSGSGLQVV